MSAFDKKVAAINSTKARVKYKSDKDGYMHKTILKRRMYGVKNGKIYVIAENKD